MTTSAHRPGPRLSSRAVGVRISEDDAEVVVSLEDGRTIAVPIAWFPRLAGATPVQRDHWKLIGRGIGIHWPDIDEDISVENLLGVEGELIRPEAPIASELTEPIVGEGWQDPAGSPDPTRSDPPSWEGLHSQHWRQ